MLKGKNKHSLKRQSKHQDQAQREKKNEVIPSSGKKKKLYDKGNVTYNMLLGSAVNEFYSFTLYMNIIEKYDYNCIGQFINIQVQVAQGA